MPKQISAPSGIPEEAKEIDSLLEQERLIDAEIKQEIDKYKMSKQIGIYMDDEVREAGSLVSDEDADQDDEDARRNDDDDYLCEGDEENDDTERIANAINAGGN